MAKKRLKAKSFSFQGFDARHYRTTEQYTKAVDSLFNRATMEIAVATADGTYNPDKPFSFADYPRTNAKVQSIVTDLANNITTVIEQGSRKQWLFACQKNDEFVESIMDTSKLSKARLNKMQDRNLDSLQTFQERKVDGMNLSERVWKYTKQYKAQIEQGLDVGLGEGRSAQQLSRDLRQNLREPDILFRRVRDKRGNLVLSKNARAFHPGQGVYRSSAKNAARLTRSEINMAYREADWLRWQQLDFVIGFEVHRSNRDPLPKCKMCDQLVGRYPKTFKFKGWHPQCMCFATAILMDEQDFDNQELSDLKSALRGEPYKKLQVKNAVTDVPDGFKDWVAENTDKQANWGSTPYFIKDNFKGGELSKGLKHEMTQEPEEIVLDPIQEQLNALMPQINEVKQLASTWGAQTMALDNYIAKKDINGITRQINVLKNDFAEQERLYAKYMADLVSLAGEAMKYKVDLSVKLSGVITRRDWYSDVVGYENELENLKNQINLAKQAIANNTSSTLDEFIKTIDKAGVAYNEVKKLTDTLTESDIIERVGGGDMTKGSCSSLAFTYAGNKSGLDVLDFRDGESRKMFSSTRNIMEIAKKSGGVVEEHTNDFAKANTLLKTTEVGKEYYFSCGSHAAIVRKTKTGYEYLELQSATSNGFKPLTNAELKNRFGAKKSHTSYGTKYKTKDCIIEIGLLKKNNGFQKMLGYINTKEDEQKKGKRGTTK